MNRLQELEIMLEIALAKGEDHKVDEYLTEISRIEETIQLNLFTEKH